MPILFGITSAGKMVPIRVNDDGLIDVQSSGWIGAAWQKNPLLIGYSGDWTEQKSDLNAAAGSNTLTGTAVPAGEIWEVQAITGIDVNSTITDMFLYCTINGTLVHLVQTGARVAGQYGLWAGKIVLSPGDTVHAQFTGCTLNDDIYLRYHAVRVDVDQ